MNGPRHFQYVTEEIVKSGCIEIHSTAEDMDKISQVHLYNQYMKECRQKMKDLHFWRNFYLIINILLTMDFMLTKYVPILLDSQSTSAYAKLIIDVIIVIIHLFICFLFCLWKGELDIIPNVLSTGALLFIDELFLIQLIFNLIFCGFYRYKKGSLGQEPGYPLFYDIRIDRVRGKVYDTRPKVPVYPKIEKEYVILEEINEDF